MIMEEIYEEKNTNANYAHGVQIRGCKLKLHFVLIW